MRRVVATGRTVEEAVTSALVRLGSTKSQATIRVITEPVRPILGFIGGREAQVEVSVPQAPDEAARDFLAEVLLNMGVQARVRQGFGDSSTNFHLEIQCDEEDLPTIIGRHGATLDSLQYLATLAGNKEQAGYAKIVLDAGGYRQRRREGLQQMANRAVERVLRTGRPILLDPMSATDRKVIHSYLQTRRDVGTVSEGVEPNRKIRIIPHQKSSAHRSKPPVQSMGGGK